MFPDPVKIAAWNKADLAEVEKISKEELDNFLMASPWARYQDKMRADLVKMVPNFAKHSDIIFWTPPKIEFPHTDFGPLCRRYKSLYFCCLNFFRFQT